MDMMTISSLSKFISSLTGIAIPKDNHSDRPILLSHIAGILLLTTFAFSCISTETANTPSDPFSVLPHNALKRFGSTRWRHTSTINTITYSPDGTYIASGGYDSYIKIWDSCNGRDVTSLHITDGPITALKYINNTPYLAASGHNGILRIWDITGSYNMRSFRLGSGSLWSISPNSTSSSIAVCGDNSYLALINSDNYEIRTFPKQHKGKIFTALYSPDDLTVASGGDDGRIIVWDAHRGTPIKIITGHYGAVRSMFYHPSGSYLWSSGDDGLIIKWDIKSGTPVSTTNAHKGPIRSITLSPEGHSYASAGDDGYVRIWNLKDNSVIHEFRPHINKINCIAYSPNGALLASGGSDCVIGILDIARKNLLNLPLGHQSKIRYISYRDNGIIASIGEDYTARFWGLTRNHKEYVYAHNNMMHCSVICNNNPRTAAIGDTLGRVLLYNIKDNVLLRTLWDGSGKVIAININNNNDAMLVAWDNGSVGEYDIPSYRLKRIIRLNTEGVKCFSATETFNNIAYYGNDGMLYAFSLDKGVVIGKTPIESGELISAYIITNGDYIVGVCGSGKLYVWCVNTGNIIITGMLEDNIDVYCSAMSYDERYVALGGYDGKIRVFELASGKMYKIIDAQEGSVHAIAYSRDNKYIASSHANSTILMWDAYCNVSEEQGHTPAGDDDSITWNDLGSDDTYKSNKAVFAYYRMGSRGLVVIKNNILENERRIDIDKIKKAIGDLDDDNADKREIAMSVIRKDIIHAEPYLRRIKASGGHKEIDIRIEQMLAEYDRPVGMKGGELLRGVRAIAIIESVGGDEARKVLKEIENNTKITKIRNEARNAYRRITNMAFRN